MRGYETARQVVAKHRAAVRAMAEELLVRRIARRGRHQGDHGLRGVTHARLER